MRKLRPAEIKFLEAIPETILLSSNTVLPGTQFQRAKGTNAGTLSNLEKMGLIFWVHYDPYGVQGVRITERGNKLLGRPDYHKLSRAEAVRRGLYG
jgi:hypothetical protein